VKSSSQTYPMVRWRDGQRQSGDDPVTVEEPLEIRVNGEAVAVTMRTPGHDEELAAGFCLTEGIVVEGDEIVSVEFCGGATTDNVVDVRVDDRHDTAQRRDAIERTRRVGYLSSSCGICGKQTLDRIEQVVHPFAPSSFAIATRRIASLPAKMRRRQTVFSRTGGLHSAALFDADGSLVALREDVGRHNAVDKVIGRCVLTRGGRIGEAGGGDDERRRAILLVSGRASFEIVQKAAVAGIPFVAAVSAPSSLAIDLARRLDMTLVGFLRAGRLNVYCGGRRIAQ
jgi:FdhD protein